jgi:hypothetical protein
MKIASIKLYSFDELTAEAKVFAINEHTDFLNSIPQEFEDESRNMKSEYIQHNEDEVIESIQANNYLFFADGELASVCHYVGNHPQAGETEFKFKGEVYIL